MARLIVCPECLVETDDHNECGSCHGHFCETCFHEHERECWEAYEEEHPQVKASDVLGPNDCKLSGGWL